ncbi:unnamed protein product [Durusdinium trenchii]|uniref:Uncharacterized protein n=1 Tax=Durusdinium trenchii TaxID=1381693 RepID=A0ABP0T0C6_9DINO
MDRFLYLQILGFFIDWIKDADDGDEFRDRLERFEASRETVRAILSVSGVHRMTEILAEAWQLMTAIKIHGANPLALSADIVPIAGASPASEPTFLHAIGYSVPYTTILEEETATLMDFIDDLVGAAEVQDLGAVIQWLIDFRLIIGTAHFGLVHRDSILCAAMAGKVTTKQRITADPSIGVADLLECLEGWLDEEKNYNLDKMLKPPKEATWKTVADPDWLSKLAPLWTRYIKLAPNGVIPSKKHRTSIEKLCERKEIPKGKLSTEAFAEDMGERIRIGLSQLRGIKVCPLARQRCLRKTGPEEQKVIEGLIALLTDLEEVDNPSTKPSTAIVPFERKDSPESLEAHEPSSSKGVNPIDVMIDPLSVFSRVLAKPDFDDHDDVPPSSSRAFGKTLKTTVSSPSKFVGFLAGAELDPQELRLLKACQAQEPLNKGFNSQLQRANKAIKKLKAEETDDEHEEEEDQGKTLGQSPGAKTTKVKSKAKKGGKGSSKGKKKNCAAKKDGKAKVETMEPQESQDELPKTGTKSEEKKSTKTEKQVKPDEENPGESSKLEDVPEGKSQPKDVAKDDDDEKDVAPPAKKKKKGLLPIMDAVDDDGYGPRNPSTRLYLKNLSFNVNKAHILTELRHLGFNNISLDGINIVRKGPALDMVRFCTAFVFAEGEGEVSPMMQLLMGRVTALLEQKQMEKVAEKEAESQEMEVDPGHDNAASSTQAIEQDLEEKTEEKPQASEPSGPAAKKTKKKSGKK